MRKEPLITNHIYHVFNKSIAGYKIFTHDSDYQRFLNLLQYFNLDTPPAKFSFFLERHPDVLQYGVEVALHRQQKNTSPNIQIISYCLMPTHFHLLAKQLKPHGVSSLLKNTLNGYTRYFNIKYKRQGVLWTGRFQNRVVLTDEQMIHVSRYIHLNPTTAGLVETPESWPYSSYKEFIGKKSANYPIAQYREFIDMSPKNYKSFCSDHVSYQRELALIKHEILE